MAIAKSPNKSVEQLKRSLAEFLDVDVFYIYINKLCLI